jgi:hypothetical protein
MTFTAAEMTAAVDPGRGITTVRIEIVLHARKL